LAKENQVKETEWLRLFDGTSLGKWVGVAEENVGIEGDALVITDHPRGEGVRAEVGGASLAIRDQNQEHPDQVPSTHKEAA